MKAFIAILLLGILIQPVFATYEDTLTWNLDAKGIKELRIDIPCGSVDVKTGSNVKEITITADVTIRKMSDKDAEQFVKNWHLDLVKNGETASFLYNGKTKRGTKGVKKNVSVEFSLVIEIPENMNLNIDTGAGNISINGVKGNLDIESGAGNVSITDIQGNVTVATGAGNMKFKKITGSVEADTGAGNLTFFNITGDIAADCGAGNITIDTCSGYVDVDTGIGNIDVSGVKRKVKANTGLGKCTIEDEA